MDNMLKKDKQKKITYDHADPERRHDNFSDFIWSQ